MTRRDTVVVGASAGGVEALQELLGDLPADFPARMLIVLHVPASGTNALAHILDRVTPLEVVGAEQGLVLREGLVVVAKPDHHLLIGEGEVTLTRAPRDNGYRPAVDVLFRSAAQVLGPRVIGVILSGALEDGAAGLRAILRHGGLGVVQAPADADVRSMPDHAIDLAHPGHVVPVSEMAALLGDLLSRPLSRTGRGPSPGPATAPEPLVPEPQAEVETAMRLAIRVLDEKSAMCAGLAQQAEVQQARLSAHRFREQSDEAHQAAQVLRGLVGTSTVEEEDHG